MRNRMQVAEEASERSGIGREDIELWRLRAHAVADSMGVHRVTVSRRLWRETGRTWRQEQSRCREERAKRLLADSRLSIKEVAFILEFGSASAFSRFFLKRTGVRPSSWRSRSSAER